MGNSICLKNDFVGLEEQSEDNFPINFKSQWKTVFENYCSDHKGEFLWIDQIGMYLLQLDKFPLKKQYQEVKQLMNEFNMSINIQSTNIDQYKSVHFLEDKLVHRPSAAEYSMNRGKEEENYFQSEFSTSQQNSVVPSSTNLTRRHHRPSTAEEDKQQNATITNSFIYQDVLFAKKEHQDWTGQMKTEANTQGDFMFKLIKLIKTHLRCDQNQIHNICEFFFQSIKSNYENYNEGCYAKMKEEIQSFAEILLEIILYYYQLNHLFSGDNFQSVISSVNQPCSNYYLNKKNLLSFFQGWILEDKRVYTTIMCVLAIDNLKMIQKLGQKMILMREKQQIQGLFLLEEVNVQYRLDASTYEFFQKNFPNVERKGYRINKKPYEVAYRYLQRICDKRNVQSKLKVIVKTQEKLIQCIKNFYQEYGVPFSCNIGGDDLFPIQIYIMVMSRIIDINIHLQFCHDFALPKYINSIIGYYLMCYIAVANFIMDQDVVKSISNSKSIEKISYENLEALCENN